MTSSSNFLPLLSEVPASSDISKQFPASLVRSPCLFRHPQAISCLSCPKSLPLQTSSKQFPASLVRSPCLFRHLQAISCLSCPKSLPLQTSPSNFLPLLSEVPASSDTSKQFPASLVRSPCLFRHPQAISCLSCPKSLPLQTPPSNFLPLLSEVPASSDTSKQFPASLVRSPCLFRHLQAISCLSCPKSLPLQTPPSNFLPLLSEVPASSDTSKQFPASLVRSPCLFRHLQAISCLSCPKSLPLQTPPSNFLPLLSEVPASSDIFPASLVRSPCLFRHLQAISCLSCPKSAPPPNILILFLYRNHLFL